ncbi:hypothetical protein SAMN05444161_1062 [Rhizobiales bacterium GAS191]|nr:hypothetical protein SAMN05444161_1062 [Rhizobiales bacterium GAS191]
MSRAFVRFWCLVLGLGFQSPSWATPQIMWSVDNGLRFLQRASDYQAVRKVYDSLQTAGNPKPTALQLERTLQTSWEEGGLKLSSNASPRSGWAAGVVEHSCGYERHQDVDGFKDSYKGCKTFDAQNYINPTSVAVSALVEGIATSTGAAREPSCAWALNGQEPVKQDCKEPFGFRVDYDRPNTLEVSIDGASPIPTTISVKDILIVGFGDSFASGEGNPEVPVPLTVKFFSDYTTSSVDSHNIARYYPARATVSGTAADPAFFSKSAGWSNTQCHRSLYSQQFKAALQYALENPHRTVTFLPYGCTGASVYEGILNAWRGRADHHDGLATEFRRDDAPQIVKLWRDLCRTSDPAYDQTKWEGDDTTLGSSSANVAPCSAGLRRPIDALLLSIAGNDVGFAPMLAWAFLDNGLKKSSGSILSNRGLIYGLWKDLSGPQDFATGKTKTAHDLPGLYTKLKQALSQLGAAPGEKLPDSRVILSAYPDISKDQSGKICAGQTIGMDVHAIFGVKRGAMSEADSFIQYFRQHMLRYAHNRGWGFADQHFTNGQPNSFARDDHGLGHGLCALKPDVTPGVDEMAFPTPPRPFHPGSDPVWRPKNPDSWWPYSPLRNRWVVTPNDAFMAANFHDVNIAPNDPVQPLFAATLSGAFHINNLGQAAVADSIMPLLRGLP